MPVLTNSIGTYEFLEIQGAPHLRQEQLELIERAGVDGSGVRKLGARGKPFQIRTINYETDFAAAKSKMDNYKALVGADPVELIRQDETEGTFLVLGVIEEQRYAIMNAVGGLVGGEECCHIVNWTMLG